MAAGGIGGRVRAEAVRHARAGGGALGREDPEVAALLGRERRRQREQLALAASESPASRAVRAAEAGALASRYGEGPAGARHGAGWAHADAVEELARARLCDLFGAEHANVQPHSGGLANLAAYAALLRPGDVVLSMDPAAGGHLTHGAQLHLAGRLYRFVHYGVRRDDERIDYDEVAALARRHRPALVVAGGSAYPRALDYRAFGAIARSVGARLLVDAAHTAGLVAAGLHESPLPHADVVTMTTHKSLCGPRGGAILCRAADARAVDRAVFPGVQGGPMLHAVAAKAVACGEAARPPFAAYQRRAVDNSAALAAGLAAADIRCSTGGTDTHLLVLDLRATGVSGRLAERALERAGVVCGRQLLPFDPQPPTRCSGLRLGTLAVTARGMGPAEMGEIAAVVAQVLGALDSERAPGDAAGPASRVRALTARFPLPA